MARNSGTTGRVYMALASGGSAESVAYLAKWSLSQSVDFYDVTSFEDATKTNVAGKPDASGTFSGFWDDATVQSYTAALDGVARKIYLYPKTPSSSGPYWFGTAFADFSIDVDANGANTVSGTFKAATPFAKVG